jgi:K+-sensing histidine kinase KdpD
LSPSQRQEAVRTIRDSGQHLLTLINDILDISRIEARRLELRPVDVALPYFLKGVAEIIAMRAEEKGLRFICDPPTLVPRAVHADEVRLRQVLLNLLGNAVKFTDEGTVTFRVMRSGASAPSGEPKTRIRLKFEVTDTGAGIPPEQVERIFLPFEQADAGRLHGEGSGLGLAISQALVQAMGGRIQVLSAPGKGSCFWFELDLPVVMQPDGQRKEPEAQRPETGARLSGAALQAPPPEDLRVLHELALMGNMEKIKTWASELKGRGQIYHPFADRLRRLAGGFRTRAIIELVECYMEGGET